VYERAQEGLHARGRDWINVGRLYDPAERGQVNVATNGTNEWQMRNQFRAWARYMTATMSPQPTNPVSRNPVRTDPSTSSGQGTPDGVSKPPREPFDTSGRTGMDRTGLADGGR